MDTKLSRKLEKRFLELQTVYEITRKQFFKIVYADPTAKVVDNMLIGGKYTNWLLKYSNEYFAIDSYLDHRVRLLNVFFREDLPKTTVDLVYYTNNSCKFPKDKRDINKISSFVELYQIVESVRKIQTTSQLKKKALEHSIELTTGNSNKRVFIPLTEEASIYLGMMTRWCTAATESENWFDHYFKKGFLYYVFIRKEDGAIKKFAFHFETDSHFDELDRSIDDVHGFFREHQEVANAIAGHRKSIKSEYGYLADLLLLNQQIFPQNIRRYDLSWVFLYGAVSNKLLQPSVATKCLPRRIDFEFAEDGSGIKLIVDDWSDLSRCYESSLTVEDDSIQYESFYYLSRLLTKDNQLLMSERFGTKENPFIWNENESKSFLRRMWIESGCHCDTCSDAIKNAIRETLCITREEHIQVNGDSKLMVVIGFDAFPFTDMFNALSRIYEGDEEDEGYSILRDVDVGDYLELFETHCEHRFVQPDNCCDKEHDGDYSNFNKLVAEKLLLSDEI